MHEHQRAYLVAELRRPEWAGLTVDAAYAKMARPPKAFLAVSFVSQSKYDRMSPKSRGRVVPVPDEYAAKFPGGLPGMPNLIRSDEFAAAWKEARGEAK